MPPASWQFGDSLKGLVEMHPKQQPLEFHLNLVLTGNPKGDPTHSGWQGAVCVELSAIKFGNKPFRDQRNQCYTHNETQHS